MVPRREGDGIFRVGFHNIRGKSFTGGLEAPYEIDAMDELGINMQGFGETNKPWTPGNRWRYNHLMATRFKGSRTFYSSAPASYDCTYQPGGTVLTVNGHCTGRIVESGEDDMGRFCWVNLREKREEGVCALFGYRCCRNLGPFTAYTA